MDKKTILLRDKNFCSPEETIRTFSFFDWEVDYNCCKNGPITVFTDHCLNTVDNCTSDIKIAWLLDSPAIVNFAYNYIEKNYQKFNYVLTFCKYLLKYDNRFVFYPFGTKWIDEKDWGIPAKKKMVSTIASNKSYAMGHYLRHKAIAILKSCKFFDIMGSGYRKIENKIEGLRDYQYSLTMENCQEDYYFTEKLMDCFLTGTVPIYWGGKGIGDVFDSKGIISFNTIEELPDIFEKKLSFTDYQNRINGIKNNFEIAKKYAHLDVNLWNSFFKDFLTH